MKGRCVRRIHAFTLIELLVVVGIISLLLAILLPALAGAKEQSLRSRCATNHRQLITATLLYAQESRESMPMPNWAWSDGSKEPTGWLYDPPFTTPVAEDLHKTGTLWRYLERSELYRCPTHYKPYVEVTLPAQKTIRTTSYLMNGAVVGYEINKSAFPVTRFRGNAIIFWEAQEPTWNDGASYPTEGLTTRHGNGATVSYIDGHVRWITHNYYNDQLDRPGVPSDLWCAPDTADGR